MTRSNQIVGKCSVQPHLRFLQHSCAQTLFSARLQERVFRHDSSRYTACIRSHAEQLHASKLYAISPAKCICNHNFFLGARPQLTVQVNGNCNSFATTTDTRGPTMIIMPIAVIIPIGATKRITAATISATTTSTSASAPTAHTAWTRAAPSAHMVEK